MRGDTDTVFKALIDDPDFYLAVERACDGAETERKAADPVDAADAESVVIGNNPGQRARDAFVALLAWHHPGTPARTPLKWGPNGLPILSLGGKIASLQRAIESDNDADALNHLFDLIAHVAPGYRLDRMDGIQALADRYGSTPTPIRERDRA